MERFDPELEDAAGVERLSPTGSRYPGWERLPKEPPFDPEPGPLYDEVYRPAATTVIDRAKVQVGVEVEVFVARQVDQVVPYSLRTYCISTQISYGVVDIEFLTDERPLGNANRGRLQVGQCRKCHG